MNDFWTIFLSNNSAKFKLLRTIAQGVIGVIIANLDLLISYLTIPAEVKPMIVALVMAILSPIMAQIGGTLEDNQRISAMVADMVEEPEGSASDEHFTDEEIEAYRAHILEMEGGDEDDI